MADNVGIITGTGATIATDQNTGSPNEHYQIVKAAFGTRDTNTFTVVDSTHGLPVVLGGAAASLADGTANPSTSLIGSLNSLYNGSTWDRQRPNITGVVQASGTTTTTTNTLTTYNARFAVIVLNVSAVTGGKITLALNGITSSSYSYAILTPSEVSTAVTTPYRIGPGLTPSAGAVANDILPRTLQVIATVTGTITYGIDFILGV